MVTGDAYNGHIPKEDKQRKEVRRMKEVVFAVGRYAFSPLCPARRRRLAGQVLGRPARYLPADLLYAVRTKRGFGTMLLADLFLFGLCLAADVLIDFVVPLLFAVRAAIGAAACILAFGLLEDEPRRALMKLMMIAMTVSGCGLWTLTTLFMLLFEHLFWSKEAESHDQIAE